MSPEFFRGSARKKEGGCGRKPTPCQTRQEIPYPGEGRSLCEIDISTPAARIASLPRYEVSIQRIHKIKKHRVFQNFSWPAELHEFGRFNVIYGWNGAGKTTLSNLFRLIEQKQDLLEGDAEFLIDGHSVSSRSLSTSAGLPRLKVFNRDYVEQNFFVSKRELSPIYYLGEDSIDKQKKIEALKIVLEKNRENLSGSDRAKKEAENLLETFCQQQAKGIKELLSSSPSNSYNTYNKANFRQIAERFVREEDDQRALSDSAKSALKQQKESKPLPAIGELSVPHPNSERFTALVEGVLGRTVVSKVIEKLATNAQVSEWVQSGLKLHTGDNAAATCHFCSNSVSAARIEELEGHFNDEYAKFLAELAEIEESISQTREDLLSVDLPIKEQFYDHFATKHAEALRDIEIQIRAHTSYLGMLLNAVKKKRGNPFAIEKLQSYVKPGSQPSSSDFEASFKTFEDLVASHNGETFDFEKVVSNARVKLEASLVQEAIDEFKKKVGAISAAVERLTALAKERDETSNTVRELESEILGHLKPAEELNFELRNYLGRDELTFSVKETGYEVSRHGIPAANLSEGERTAIAFLYFLKSLQDAGFSLSKDIVVIDDPVSSLDTNALFCAFGYMKDRTKDSGQMFILTHNFGFFRQVKNWFNHMPNQRKGDVEKRPARFFMLESESLDGKRNGCIKPLDSLLHRFDSEYHYLFNKVLEVKSEPPAVSLEAYYVMPNVARRLLESFLSFRYPAEAGELQKQLERVGFDPAKKSRILRFLHTYSHDGRVAEPEHDLSVLAETPQVMSQILELIAAEDMKHYTEMISIVQPSS